MRPASFIFQYASIIISFKKIPKIDFSSSLCLLFLLLHKLSKQWKSSSLLSNGINVLLTATKKIFNYQKVNSLIGEIEREKSQCSLNYFNEIIKKIHLLVDMSFFLKNYVWVESRVDHRLGVVCRFMKYKRLKVRHEKQPFYFG